MTLLGSRRRRLAVQLMIIGLMVPLLACGHPSAKDECPNLEKHANITSPPSKSEIDGVITALEDAQNSDSNPLNIDVDNALRDADAVKAAIDKPGNSDQVDQLLQKLNADMNGISNDCSQIMGG